ncbi:Vacuolar protein sorting-associated protein 20 [Allomyces javanicus]|nr:Vacuolar protein sorting-associated protein 20 [Allomyces javanicus]
MGQGSSKPKASAHDKAVFELKKQRDVLRKYQKQLATILDREHAIAKQCLAAGDKRRALLALRKKKYQEQLLAKTDQQLMTLEEMTSTLEYAVIEKEVMAGLQQGNTVLQALHQEMSVEKVEAILDETAEAIAYQKEIEELLGTKLSEEDEAEVERELALIQEEAALALETKMPSVPVTAPPVPEDTGVEVEVPAAAAAEKGKEKKPASYAPLPA